MASILDRYGIKEVADVTFYNINSDGTRGNPVLYLDTLKVSTIEQTAETSDARGGKGNPKLITWDYGKDITVTLEDALFSPKSLAIMFGDGKVRSGSDVLGYVEKTVMARVDSNGTLEEVVVDVFEDNKAVRKKVKPSDFGAYKLVIVGTYKEDGTPVTSLTKADAGTRVFVTYQLPAARKEIVVSADTFPGTYYVTGDTYARSDVTGEDQFFQFIIQKAKVTSENTITLEAEGDPSVFNMNLSVLRPEDGEMMKLVQYDLTGERSIYISGPSTVEVDSTIELIADVAPGTEVTWSSDAAEEAAVVANEDNTAKATVTAIEEGYVGITATTDSGTGTFVVHVVPKAEA